MPYKTYNIMDNELLYPFEIFDKSPERAINLLRANMRQRRLEKGVSRKYLSELTGVPAPTIERFETTGKISLESFVKIVCALDYFDELITVMDQPKYHTMDELREIQDNEYRKRGRRCK